MNSLSQFLQFIPQAAASPLALLAYIFVLVAVVILGLRVTRNRTLLSHIREIPEADRRQLLQAEMNVVIPSDISSEQWLRSRTATFMFIGFVIAIISLSTVIIIALYYANHSNSAKLSVNGPGPRFIRPVINSRTIDGCINSSEFPSSENNECIRSAQQIVANKFCRDGGYSAASDFKAIFTGQYQLSWQLHRELSPQGVVETWVEDNQGGYIFTDITCKD